MTAYTIAMTNQKGGVGKTTTAVNLAASLSALGQRVLLVDLDPQGNATTGSGIDKQGLTWSIYPLLLGQANFSQVCQHSKTGGYDILPAERHLGGAEVELVDLPERGYRLRDSLEAQKSHYDYILLDCPPALNLLTINGLAAADALLIPVLCEYYALEGLSDLIHTLQQVQQGLNPNIQLMGLVRTMFDTRSNLAQQVSQELMTHFSDKVFKTTIPRNVRVAEAPSHGMPVLIYDKHAKGSKAYMQLAQELLEWQGRKV
jgi:chromosome partitioning protein